MTEKVLLLFLPKLGGRERLPCPPGPPSLFRRPCVWRHEWRSKTFKMLSEIWSFLGELFTGSENEFRIYEFSRIISHMALTTGFWGKRHGFQPQNGIPSFSLHFPKELSYGYLRFEGNGKNSFGKVGKKVCPVCCLSLAKLNWNSQLGKHFSLPSQRNFPISFKPKVAIA